MSEMLTVIIVTVFVFLLCREIVCWYWKINQLNTTLVDILNELKKIRGEASKNNVSSG